MCEIRVFLLKEPTEVCSQCRILADSAWLVNELPGKGAGFTVFILK